MMCKDLRDDAATVVDVKKEQEVRHREDGMIGQYYDSHAAVPSGSWPRMLVAAL